MTEPTDVTTRTVEFEAADGAELIGELTMPAACRAAAIVCHPHPQFGGNRFDHVVGALFDALPAAGIAALRFDFRREYGEGVAEIEDARAALDELAAEAPGVPILATGYSFGAAVALALVDERPVGKVLVAPPLGIGGHAAEPGVPTLVLTPEHDQFCPPEVAEPIVAAWPDTEFAVVEMADHFLTGRTGPVAVETMIWIDQLLG